MNQATTEIRNKSKNAVKDVEQKSSDILGTVIPNVEKFSKDLKNRTIDLSAMVSDSLSESYEAGYSYVKKNPMKGLAVAAAAGLIVGSVTSLLFRSKKD